MTPVYPAQRQPVRRVLLVDDHHDCVDAMALVLQVGGFVTLQAFDAPTALDLVYVAKPDVAVLDIVLPGMDGLGLARTLRDDAGLRDMRIICVSGLELAGERLDALRAGLIDAYLVKPVLAPSLLQAVTS